MGSMSMTLDVAEMCSPPWSTVVPSLLNIPRDLWSPTWTLAWCSATHKSTNPKYTCVIFIPWANKTGCICGRRLCCWTNIVQLIRSFSSSPRGSATSILKDGKQTGTTVLTPQVMPTQRLLRRTSASHSDYSATTNRQKKKNLKSSYWAPSELEHQWGLNTKAEQESHGISLINFLQYVFGIFFSLSFFYSLGFTTSIHIHVYISLRGNKRVVFS